MTFFNLIKHNIFRNKPRTVLTILSISLGIAVIVGLAVSAQAEVLNPINRLISLLAIIIGGMIVANTMLTSVFERTREIGVLRAVGWSKYRVVELIIYETLMISLTGVFLGLIIGALSAKVAIMILNEGNLMRLTFTPWMFVRVFIIGIVLSIIGGIYPAYRAAKLSPIEALRHE